MKSDRLILFVNPWIHDFAAFDFWVKPLGLLYLASFFRINGYGVRYLDCLNGTGRLSPKRNEYGAGRFMKQAIDRPEPLVEFPRPYFRYGVRRDHFIQCLSSLPHPNLIMVTSMMTYWYPGVFATIQALRSVYPQIPLILGGIYASLCPNHAALSGADRVLTGPGEMHIAGIIEDVFGHSPSFLADFNDPDSHPYPAFDLIPQPDPVPILTARGCPHHCTYCAAHRLYSGFRRRDPFKVADEIRHWHQRFGVKNFSFYDDALLVDPDVMALPLLRTLRKRGDNVLFHCPNGLHARALSSELAKLMFMTGFRTIRLGFESSDPTLQQQTGGKVRNDDLVRAIRYLKEAGYEGSEIGVYLLCGLPGQTARQVEASIHFVQSLGAKPMLAEYSPIPGTDLWDDACNASLYNLSAEPLCHNNTLLPCRSDSLTFSDYRRLKQLARNPSSDLTALRHRPHVLP